MPTLKPPALHALISLVARRMGSDAAEDAGGRRPPGARQPGRARQPRRRHAARLCAAAARRPAGAEPDAADGAGRRRAAGDRRPARLRPAHGRGRSAARDRAGQGAGRLRAGAAQCLPYRAHRHLCRAGGAPRHARSSPSSTSPIIATCRPRMAAPSRAWAPTRSAPRCPGGDDGAAAMLLDMATTTIAAGKARVAYNKGVPVPEGCADRRRRPADQRPDRVDPRPHRRAAVVRQAQGLRAGGDVRDHGRRRWPAVSGRSSRVQGRHPEFDAGRGDRSGEAGRSRGGRRRGRRARRISAPRA